MTTLELENHIFTSVVDFAIERMRHAQEVHDIDHARSLLDDAQEALKAAYIQLSMIRTMRAKAEACHAPSF